MSLGNYEAAVIVGWALAFGSIPCEVQLPIAAARWATRHQPGLRKVITVCTARGEFHVCRCGMLALDVV